MQKKLILVTGATGYIAGRLIPRLLERGLRVRCLVRRPEGLSSRSWGGRVELVTGDLTSPETCAAALQGVETAYYLVHNMSSGRQYPQRDLLAARNFASAAEEAGLQHVIYLGGLADPAGSISPHMRSRIQTGEALRAGRVPVTEFRAGIIVGPGSISFEMIRFLTEQLPLLIGPAWLRNRAHPIADTDVLAYLLAALDVPACRGRVLEIGGTEQFTYAGIMLEYARMRGLRRSLLLVPGIPTILMAWLVERLTPVPASIARPLIEGLQADSLVRDPSARQLFPDLQPAGYRAALQASLARLHPDGLELPFDPLRPVRRLRQDGFLLDIRQVQLDLPPGPVFQLLGGLNGRTTAFREEERGPGCLRLRLERPVPGRGWLEWRTRPAGTGTQLVQVAAFAPRGLPGFLFWVLPGPFHRLALFARLRTIVRRASRATR